MVATEMAQPALARRGVRRQPLLADNAAVRIWMQSALLVGVLAVPTLIAYFIDERQLNGISVWVKPLKFQASVALHLVMLAAVVSVLAERVRDGRLLRGAAWLSSAMGIFEIAYITAQAGRGRHSHFNAETPFELAMYSAMGIGAVTLVVTSALVGVLVLRAPGAGLRPGLRLGAGLGLLVGSVATLVVAGYLSMTGSHWVGLAGSDAGGLPVVGWSTSVGDLRVSHFFATHMMQGLPLVGWLADRHAADKPGRVVVAAAVLWFAVIAGTFVQALAGMPFIQL